MTRSIVGRLVAKDLYLQRWLIAGALSSPESCLLVISASPPGDNVTPARTSGSSSYMHHDHRLRDVASRCSASCKERHDRSQLFVLSLPLSPAQYSRAKVWAALIAFLVPLAGTDGGRRRGRPP